MKPWLFTRTVDDLLDHADTFLIDQFGTLHDGQQAYPGAPEALRRLHDAGARIALLSNSGTRAGPNVDRLARFGFPADCYDACITSGEVAWTTLRREASERSIGSVFMVTRGANRFLDGLPMRREDDPVLADLLLIGGSEADTKGLDHYRDLLRPAALRQVPCLCTNPDRTMVIGRALAPGAGAIAEIYAGMGGPVRWIGKPHAPIYQAAFAALESVAGPNVIGIGDSMEHDITGARAAGCRTAFVTTGIADALDDDAIAALVAQYGAVPDFILSRFG